MKKRILITVLVVLTALTMAFSLTGCLLPKSGGSDSDNAELVGKYGLQRFSGSGYTVSGADLEEAGLTAEDNYIEIIDGKNIDFKLMGESYSTTYKVDGDTLQVKDGTDTLEFVVDGDVISYETDEGTLYFKLGYTAPASDDDADDDDDDDGDDTGNSGSSGDSSSSSGSSGSSGSLGGGTSSSGYEGVYQLTKFSDGSTSLSGADLASVLPPEENYIEILDGKNVTFTLMGESIDSTYTVSGSQLVVKDGGSTLYFDIDGDTISYTTDDGTLYFTKS
ncbi:MAG: hypothetical protein LBR39_00245 [Coriobacteriales bacterium]|jgi:hypothetical protein|nr:hypothetical protein [Coriobacteriales bacterium]